MAGRRSKREKRPNPKPYGFCCAPFDEILPRDGMDASLPSLTSLHECPALRFREQEIVKRPLVHIEDESAEDQAFRKLSLGQSPSAGGMNLADATESMIELMIDMMRAQRQAEYEARMDRLADIGARKIKERKMKKLKCGPPCWYTDYSLSQLQHLKDLEDAMFKDKKENTINRTAHCLASIGMTTDQVTVDSQVLRKLVKEYSADIKTFICEVYKAIRGNYFEDEGLRLDYTTHERIMISGVVFLELPQIILELHKRLPPIVKFKFLDKPKAPKLMIATKMISPFLEKMYPAVNWRLYATRMFKWRDKCSTIPRPIAVLPKETKVITDEEADSDEEQKAIDQKTKQPADGNQPDAEGEKTRDSVATNRTIQAGTRDSRQISAAAEGLRGDKPLFTIENPWTEPPTATPTKYMKLFRETAPLDADAEFFSQLRRPPCKSQVSPSFRLQGALLEAQADMYSLMHEADELTGEVTRLAREILEPDTGCDACCSCRETRRAHLMWHATKGPYALIDGVAADANRKPQVIGATAMLSPAESISETSQPPCVPSTDKFVKSKIITGTTMVVDGRPVKQIGGYTKALEHVSREELRPDVDVVEVKNVPPCGCRDQERDEELEKQVLTARRKNEPLCYGEKFRPEEGPTFACGEFGKKDEPEDCGCGEDYGACDVEDECACYEMDEGFEDDECGFEDELGKCFKSKDVVVKSLKEERVLCKRCGRDVNPKCVDAANAKKSREPTNGKKVKAKCSCDSLSEFLQMDIGKAKCVMPKIDRHAKEKEAKGKSKRASRDSRQSKEGTPKRKLSKPKRVSQVVLEEAVKDDVLSSEEENESSSHESDPCGPYGDRTKSEEALPVERTLAYLADPHPPIRKAERIPVREGGRPCRCRENRNNRKILTYGIGAVVDEKENEKAEANGTRVIDGLTWVTPEPSIRGSDEYIPEYELADSPYEKQICGAARRAGKRAKGGSSEGKNNGDDDDDAERKKRCPHAGEKKTDGVKENVEEDSGDRTRDWENAFQDEFLTEFFTKERDGIPCWTECAKYKKKDAGPRRLKVMKPVCECKYERRIVKRNEDRKKWQDRQQRLKSLDKEAFLLIDDVAKAELSDDCCVDTVTVISAVTMQTPCDTPEEGRSRSQLPYPVQKIEIVNKNEEPKEEVDTRLVHKPEGARKLSKVEGESGKRESKTTDAVKAKTEVTDTRKEMERRESEKIAEEEDEVKVIVLKGKYKKQLRYLDQAEEELTSMMNAELERMAAEDEFVSLKLPNYHKLLQLSYWISYRVRGLCFTEKYKRDLMLETMKTWSNRVLVNKVSVESLTVKKKDRSKLNFDRAKYWKRKIGKLTRKFYANARQEVIEIGRGMWPTMEFGKFPHLLFKQAYFTYLPPREVDIYAFRTYLIK